ncbi:MAG: P-loop NTPase fold protein [Terracidiphilus sp.]
MRLRWLETKPTKWAMDALWTFLKREWTSVFVSSGVGVFVAALLRLLLSDRTFSEFCKSKYTPIRNHFDGLHAYLPFVIGLALALAIALLPRIYLLIKKGLCSWLLGVTSGLRLLPFFFALAIFAFYQTTVFDQCLLDLKAVVALVVISSIFYLIGLKRSQGSVKEEDVQVTAEDLKLAGTRVSDSDDPISAWPEDILGRAPIINTISFSLLSSKTPVLALFGELGSGKTSVLNLLRDHLGQKVKKKAIVVYFNCWLPGSSECLASYLLDDIARECGKRYIIPGIRKDARKLALALAKNVPLLNSVSDMWSTSTQRDDLQRLADAISRLPRRVIVLLDEIDRMQKEEVLELLKVLRGISVSSNLSYVCASDRVRMASAVSEGIGHDSNVYLEKFFPTSISLPVIDEDTLKVIGVRKLVSKLTDQGWFEVDADRETYSDGIEKIWHDLIAPFCQTPRSIGLLANDVSAASLPLRGEVNPIELTLIEVLRRFEPSVYEIVWRYKDALAGPENSWVRYHYRTDDQKQAFNKGLIDELHKATEGTGRLDAVRGVLERLFPLFAQIDGKRPWLRGPNPEGAEAERNIANPALLRAYFHQKLPEDIFSSREMNNFIRTVEEAPDIDTRRHELFRVLDSMKKGDPRRENFLEKLSDRMQTIDLSLATDLVHGCMLAADKYGYDLFVSTGEAGDALRMVIRVALRIPAAQRTAFLSQCMLEAGDDTFALRIQTALSKPGHDFNLGVSFAELYPSFLARMMNRYGPNSDAHNMDLTYSDPAAFNLWGMSDLSKEGIELDTKTVNENRAVQCNFWLRYIGTSKKRLAEVFATFFMPKALYTGNPEPFIENKIPVAELRRLLETPTEDETLTKANRLTLHILQRLLNGEFVSGVAIDDWESGELG